MYRPLQRPHVLFGRSTHRRKAYLTTCSLSVRSSLHNQRLLLLPSRTCRVISCHFVSCHVCAAQKKGEGGDRSLADRCVCFGKEKRRDDHSRHVMSCHVMSPMKEGRKGTNLVKERRHLNQVVCLSLASLFSLSLSFMQFQVGEDLRGCSDGWVVYTYMVCSLSTFALSVVVEWGITVISTRGDDAFLC